MAGIGAESVAVLQQRDTDTDSQTHQQQEQHPTIAPDDYLRSRLHRAHPHAAVPQAVLMLVCNFASLAAATTAALHPGVDIPTLLPLPLPSVPWAADLQSHSCRSTKLWLTKADLPFPLVHSNTTIPTFSVSVHSTRKPVFWSISRKSLSSSFTSSPCFVSTSIPSSNNLPKKDSPTSLWTASTIMKDWC
ncbi:uncharacterized protein CLUP02_13952 [Colletotrichum lupini]|uniref:Uncharacterized protein n=1 Tax=Colletotrichum lupini TaxID=145971 RepID=A0A9Q8T3W4_9PEZI|nr:uncharacterized protein CLUP02_13952 [Colletotrichum lupini]UQC88428.1 hypothetical protein CLUP02_13952 [Colletotrichum lupini]